ncbi:MAG: SPOR domain-containing protein [Pseudomonadota bacterium]
MSRPNPPRGASRSPRPAGKTVNTGRGGRRTTKTAGKSSPANKPGIKKGRLIVGLLLLAGLIALIVLLMKKPAPPVATVPPALTEEKIEKPAPTPKPAERFAFYELLPNQKVLPTRSIESRPAPRPNPNAAIVSDGSFWLQAGAFRSATEADARRSAISQLGLPARVQSQREGGATLQRVLVGPFNQIERRDQARSKLGEAGLDAIPVSASVQSKAESRQP